MKKLLFPLLALCLSSSVFAWGSPYFGPALFLQDITTPNSNFRGLQPQIAIGYSGYMDFYYLAAEVFFTPFAYTITSNHSGAEGNSLRVSQDVGASFLPGILLSEGVVAYLRLGIINTKFRAPSMNKTGGHLGIGLQTDLYGPWSLRGEYDYVAYADASDLGSPESDEFGLGLIYRFDS